MIHYDLIPGTPVGNVFIAATNRGLCAVLVGDKSLDTFKKRLTEMFRGEVFEKDPARTRKYRRELEEYFRGERTRFTVPVDLSAVRSPFRQKVLRKLHELPFGRVTTYGDLARQSGSPRAARAVGSTMATNPLSIVIPCHRVVGSSGGLGGFSGGLSMKRKLLVLEGVEPKRSGLLKAARKSK